MPRSDAYFTDSPLSSPPNSPQKQSTFAVDSDQNMDFDDHVAGAGASDQVFEVEAILARRGGKDGKTLMYKIRWVS